MKLHTSDLLIICAYLIAMIVIGLILKKRAAQNMDSYFLVQCIRNVRHHRYDANGLLGICLRIQKSLDSLAVAGIQSDIPHGLSVGVVAAFQCAHRSRMDQNPLR